MPSRFFVTGTDTNVGKTVVCAVVCALLCAALDALYWKPIQTGRREGTDRRTVINLAELPRFRAIREAYCLAPPLSPHLAAELSRVQIELGKISLPKILPNENVIVEGAGGVLVPINKKHLMVDLMKHLKLPVLLVARTSLGTINHSLLSLAALRSRRVPVRGVILVGRPNRENLEAIERYGNIEVVGTIPWLDSVDRKLLLRVFRKYFGQN
jgi:dethiobiotin synthetase